MLTHPAVTVVGGGEHLVSWQADTPDGPMLVIQMLTDQDLPGLQNCGRLPRARAQQACG